MVPLATVARLGCQGYYVVGATRSHKATQRARAPHPATSEWCASRIYIFIQGLQL